MPEITPEHHHAYIYACRSCLILYIILTATVGTLVGAVLSLAASLALS
jgi:hypothetical protein